MATVLLIRHGRTAANTAGTLAGRTPGVGLEQRGREQVAALGLRLARVPVAAIVTSPLRRCRQTAQAVAAAQSGGPPIHLERGLVECDYGEWTGRALKDLSKEKLWAIVQQQPSAMRFPGGEAMTEMAARAAGTVRRWNDRIDREHGDHSVWVAVSHADVIKAILADALGMHLDSFQRILVDPASVSVVRYTAQRPYVVVLNSAAPLAELLEAPSPPPSDAPVGGGLGSAGESQ